MSQPQETPQQNQQDKIDLIDINITQQSLNFINEMANKANQKGLYELNESFKLMLSINNLSKALETLNKLQTIALQKIKEQEGTPAQ